MASTHYSLHYHAVFSTKNRESWFAPDFVGELHHYLGGCIRGLNGKSHIVGGVDDHVHLLFGLTPSHTLADVMRDLKSGSSSWVKEKLNRSAFSWQEGYGAFTVSAPDLEKVRSYIRRQPAHHKKGNYEKEYVGMLERGLVEYDDNYLW